VKAKFGFPQNTCFKTGETRMSSIIVFIADIERIENFRSRDCYIFILPMNAFVGYSLENELPTSPHFAQYQAITCG
jgi:hypothetical protein